VSCGVSFAAFEAHWTATRAEKEPARAVKTEKTRAASSPLSTERNNASATRLALPVSGQAAEDVYASLADLVGAGIDTGSALQLLVTGSKGRVKRALEAALEKVTAGGALCDAMSHAPALFSFAETAAVRFAEGSEQVAMSLRALSRGVAARLELKRQVAQSMLFPFVVVVVHALLSPIALLIRDDPSEFSSALVRNIALLALTVAIFGWGLPLLLRTRAVANGLRGFGWRIPWLAAFFIHHSRGLFCQALADSLDLGLDHTAALRSAAAICGDPGIDKRVEQVIGAIEGGGNLAPQLSSCGLIARQDTMRVLASEHIDALSEALRLLSVRYGGLWRSRLKVFTGTVGAVLAIIVLAYAVSSLVQGYSSLTSGAGDLLNNLDVNLGLPGLP